METYRSVLEENRLTLVQGVDPEPFLDFLLQNNVLNDEDCESVQNRYVHQSRRARMRAFLDIISLKGPDGVQLFLRQLGWEYPHIYEEIMRTSPEPAPKSYKQDKRSRLSCNLQQLLSVGVDMHRIKSQNNNLNDQVKEMEEMLNYQRREIEDLERENQRLRQYERDIQQNRERIQNLTTKNEEIKEENRQFLHEIRTLTLQLQAQREHEATLLSQLDQMMQQVQEKSLELNRMSIEESNLRAKFERVRSESMKLHQTMKRRQPRTPPVSEITKLQHDELKLRVEMLSGDLKDMEDTNKDLIDQIALLQQHLDEEHGEREQMHRRVCALERDKDNLQSRADLLKVTVERYFNNIKDLQNQKMKLEEERMLMQQKLWETSQASDKQFESLHAMENRCDRLLQEFEQFRQNHRYCIPEEELKLERRQKPKPLSPSTRPQPLSPGTSLGEDLFTPFHPFVFQDRDMVPSKGLTSRSGVDEFGEGFQSAFRAVTSHKPVRSDSLIVNLSASMYHHGVRYTDLQKLELKEEAELLWTDNEHVAELDLDETCHSESDCSSISSLFEQANITVLDVNGEAGQSNKDVDVPFFVRCKTSIEKEEGERGRNQLEVSEGEILCILRVEGDQWFAAKLNRRTGQLFEDQQGYVPSTEKIPQDSQGEISPHQEGLEEDKTTTLLRKNAIRDRCGRACRSQESFFQSYTLVMPMKTFQPLPVLLLGSSPVIGPLLQCMKLHCAEWANVITDVSATPKRQLFSCVDKKHNVLSWDSRPKCKSNCNYYKFIVIIITLQSQDVISILGRVLGQSKLSMDFEQEKIKLLDSITFVQRSGLHADQLVISPSLEEANFWKELHSKVLKVQNEVFWL